MTDQLNLFGDVEIDKKQQLQPRVPTGQWVKKSVSKSYEEKINNLRICIVSTVNRYESIYRQLRQKDEEIQKLKEELKKYKK